MVSIPKKSKTRIAKTLRLESHVWEKIEKQAKRAGVSVNHYISYAVEELVRKATK